MPTLVLIEDHPLLRQQATHVLQAALPGVVVLAFADAESALACCQRDPVDVVVSDLNLPGINGIALLDRLHKLQPLLPVILQTIYVQPVHQHLARLLSAYCLLDKANMATELVPAVAAALADPCRQPSVLINIPQQD